MPLYRQTLFLSLAFGPYTGHRSQQKDLDYHQTHCPNCETICSEQGAWLEQQLLLGSRRDMDDIADAFEKVHQHRLDLR